MITSRKQIERLLTAEIRATEPDFGAIEYLTSLLRKASPQGVSLADVSDSIIQPMNITVGHNYGQRAIVQAQQEAGEDNLATTLQGILQMQRLTASLEALRCLTALGTQGGDPALLTKAQELAQTMLGGLVLGEAKK